MANDPVNAAAGFDVECKSGVDRRSGGTDCSRKPLRGGFDGSGRVGRCHGSICPCVWQSSSGSFIFLSGRISRWIMSTRGTTARWQTRSSQGLRSGLRRRTRGRCGNSRSSTEMLSSWNDRLNRVVTFHNEVIRPSTPRAHTARCRGKREPPTNPSDCSEPLSSQTTTMINFGNPARDSLDFGTHRTSGLCVFR